jgi:hypothetical protein
MRVIAANATKSLAVDAPAPFLCFTLLYRQIGGRA